MFGETGTGTHVPTYCNGNGTVVVAATPVDNTSTQHINYYFGVETLLVATGCVATDPHTSIQVINKNE